MNDAAWDNEIKSIRSGLRQYKQISQTRKHASNLHYQAEAKCPVYKKIYNSMADTDERIRQSVADI